MRASRSRFSAVHIASRSATGSHTSPVCTESTAPSPAIDVTSVRESTRMRGSASALRRCALARRTSHPNAPPRSTRTARGMMGAIVSIRAPDATVRGGPRGARGHARPVWRRERSRRSAAPYLEECGRCLLASHDPDHRPQAQDQGCRRTHWRGGSDDPHVGAALRISDAAAHRLRVPRLHRS